MSGRLSYTTHSYKNRTIYELHYKFGSVYFKRFCLPKKKKKQKKQKQKQKKKTKKKKKKKIFNIIAFKVFQATPEFVRGKHGAVPLKI